MDVELLDLMGSDEDVAKAARVSFNNIDRIDAEKDIRLIHYLATHQHWSPFTHCVAKFRIKAPLFVARQLAKHQVGLSWNEVSRRYVKTDPEFYIPREWRKQHESIKQGSTGEAVDISIIEHITNDDGCVFFPHEVYEAALNTYKTLLDLGVCAEQARMVLPQAMYTEWIWTGSLYAFARIYNLRTDPHAQRECREVALKIGEILGEEFPFSWEALTGTKHLAEW